MSDSPFNVKFSRTSFLSAVLETHKNVKSVKREKDILFTIVRNNQGDKLTILGLDEYVLGLPVYHLAVKTYGRIDIICNGGEWNGYTPALKEYGHENQIGIYIINELSGALYKDTYWDYCKKDKDGKPYDYSKTA